MSIKFLVCGDPHFSSTNVEESESLIEQFINNIKEESPDVVVVLGDLLHKHDKIDMRPFHRITRFLKMIHETGVTLFVLIGNHDRANNDVRMTDEHAFNPLKLWDNTYIVDTPISVTIKETKILAVPFVPDNTFVESLQCIEDIPSHDIVFSHQLFGNCSVSKLMTEEIEKYPVHWPLNISGHIHEYEKCSHNLIYCGTPFQQNFGESTDKAIMLIEGSDIKRIYLDIVKKLTIETTIDDIDNLKIPDGKIRLKISGDATIAMEKMKRLFKTDKELSKRVKVVYESTSKINSIKLESITCGFEKYIKDKASKSEFSDLFSSMFN